MASYPSQCLVCGRAFRGYGAYSTALFCSVGCAWDTGEIDCERLVASQSNTLPTDLPEPTDPPLTLGKEQVTGEG